MEDEKIIELYWARDEAAIQETDLKYHPYCGAIAIRILEDREDAEECVNDTWLHAWNAIPPERPGILSAFLGRITRNLSIDRYRVKHASRRRSNLEAVDLELADLEGRYHLHGRSRISCAVRTRSAGSCSCADIGIWRASAISPSGMKYRKAK